MRRAVKTLSIALPERFPFATEIEVRVTDLNYGQHLGNDSLLGLIHEARVRFLRAQGLHELDFEGRSLIMVDAAICYRAEGFAGDRLTFEVAVALTGRAACDFLYRVTRPADGRLVAEAKTGVVFLDPRTRKVGALPAAARRLAEL
jgi:acyl-CoA thioesterase FadM